MKQLLTLLILVCLTWACNSVDPQDDRGRLLTEIDYSPTAFDLVYTESFPELELPDGQVLTEEKVELGQHLFYDPILSADSTMSCASCHNPELAFTDGRAVSPGIDGIAGNRSSMSLVNSGFFYTGLFWDGRVTSLEEQALLPVEDPIELHNNWPGLMTKLRNHDLYPELFRKAFGVEYTGDMTKEMAAEAIASFERILISGSSKLDLWTMGLAEFTEEELDGYLMFFDDPDSPLPDAECLHCHEFPLMSTNDFRNNGIQEAETLDDFEDKGFGTLTGFPLDNGKFRSVSLRNITLTGPYMHDGRFETLAEVIDHYNSGGKSSPNKDPLIRPLGLTDEQKQNLEAFLHTLVDTSYLENAYIVNPFN